jgi:hypothetical protein
MPRARAELPVAERPSAAQAGALAATLDGGSLCGYEFREGSTRATTGPLRAGGLYMPIAAMRC